jgi:hypothetical protein
MNRRVTLQDCLLVYALSWAIQIGFVLAYGNPQDSRALTWGVCVMFTPALVTIGFALFIRGTPRLSDLSRAAWLTREAVK